MIDTFLFKQAQTQDLFKALNLYFLPKGRALKQIEVWDRVLFLRFETGKPTFFSKKEASFITQISLKQINGLRGFQHTKKKKPLLIPKPIPLLSTEDKEMILKSAGVKN